MALNHIVQGSSGYTVIGAPTITDGVISGFSGNDYISFNQQFFFGNTDYEIVIRALISINDYNPLFGCSNNGNRVFLNSNNISYSFNSLGITGTKQVSLTFNQYYYIRVKKEGNTVKIGYSSDNKTYDEDTVTATQNLTNYSILQLGHDTYNLGTSAGLFGSIDLNNTYITVNGQPWFGVFPVEVKKHQIMGPVGYTKVDSPTITDGVFNTTSGTDYLYIDNFPQGKENVNWEVVVRAKPATDYAPLLGCASSYGGLFCQFSQTFIRLNSDADLRIGGSFNSNTYYFIRIRKQQNTYLFDYSTNGVDFVNTLSKNNILTDVTPTRLEIGHSTMHFANREYYNNSIDLNQTYIKVDGKMWYYQPAPTKYIIKDGKLVWADPNIWLENTDGSYINTGYVANPNTSISTTLRVVDWTQNYCAVFGARTDNHSTDTFLLCRNGSSDFVRAEIGAYNYQDISNMSAGTLCNLEITNKHLKCNSLELNIDLDAIVPNDKNIFLFGLNQNNSLETYYGQAKTKFYTTKIYNEGNIVRELVPVPQGLQIGNFTVPSNGLFDIVNQQFYANQGTGNFTIGRDE